MKKSAESVQTLPEGRLSKHNLWSFSAGGFGRDMVYCLTNSCLITAIMLTKEISKTDFIWIGIIMILCRIFDGCNDPLMGAIIERTRTKIGKFKPWILAGALSNALVTFLLFFVPLYGMNYVIFFIFGYLLWGITYTMNDISYWGMMPSLTSNESDRNNISTLANIFAGLGNGVVGIAAPMLTVGVLAITSTPITAYPIVAAICCAVFIGCQVMTVLMVREKPLPPVDPNVEKPSLGKMFKVIFNNKQVLWTALTMLIYNIGASLIVALSVVTIFCYIRFGYEGANASLFTTLFGISAAIIVLYPWFVKKMTRKNLSKICLGLVILGYSLMLIVGLAWNAPNSLYVISVVGAFAAIGQTLFYQNQTIGIANCVEYNEWTTGSRDEGMIFSVRPFMAKLGSALQMGIITVIFALLGIPDITNDINYVEAQFSRGEITEAYKLDYIQNNILGVVNKSVSDTLLICMTVIPIILFVFAYIIYMKKCNITEDKYAAMLKDIELRKSTGEMFAYTHADGDLSKIGAVDAASVEEAMKTVADDTVIDTAYISEEESGRDVVGHVSDSDASEKDKQDK